MPESLYRYIWMVGRRRQPVVVLLTLLVFPLAMAPLEIQRRIVDEAIRGGDLELLLVLGGAMLGFLILHGGLKFLMNIQRARATQEATAHLREAVYHCIYTVVPPRVWRERGQETAIDQGTVVSMLAAETEKLGEFIGGSLSVPVLQLGTMLVVMGYMLAIEPLVAMIGLATYAPQLVLVPLMQRCINVHNRVHAARRRELGDFVVANAGHAERERAVPEAFLSLVRRMLVARMAAVRVKFTMKFLVNLINGLGPVSILMLGGWFVVEGRTGLGTVVAFLSGFEKVIEPGRELMAFYRQLSDARMRYGMLVDTFPRLPEGAPPLPEPRLA